MNIINNKNNYGENVDAIRILNPRQAAFYWGNGLVPIDSYVGKDRYGEFVVIYIFDRQATIDTGVYSEWCTRKQERYEKQIQCGS